MEPLFRYSHDVSHDFSMFSLLFIQTVWSDALACSTVKLLGAVEAQQEEAERAQYDAWWSAVVFSVGPVTQCMDSANSIQKMGNSDSQ